MKPGAIRSLAAVAEPAQQRYEVLPDGSLEAGRPHRDVHALGAGLPDQAPCPSEVRRGPGAARVGVQRVAARGRVVREAGRQDLARRIGEIGATGQVGDRAPVDRVVEGLPDTGVVERGRADVQEHVLQHGDGVGEQPSWAAALQRREPRRLQGPSGPVVDDHEIGRAALYIGDLRIDLVGLAHPHHDLVGEAVGAGVLRPHAEVGVADQAGAAPPVIAREAVGPGAGRRDPAAERVRGGCHVGGRERQPVEDLRVGLRETDGDRSRPRVGRDPFGEVATPLRVRRALRRAHDPRVGRHALAADEVFERGANVLGTDGLPVGEADSGPELEHVALAVGAGIGNRCGEIAHQRSERRTAGPPVGDQAVIDERGHAHEQRSASASTRSYRTDRRLDSQRPTTMAGRSRECRRPHRAVGDRDRARAALDLDRLRAPPRGGIDSCHRALAAACHPHPAGADRDRARVSGDRHDVRDLVRRRVDAVRRSRPGG